VHLISMQLTARVSLRDGISSLKARIKSLYHLGVKPVARSTFSDATTVSLCLSLFPWASFRRTKARVKLHTLLDHDGYLPARLSPRPGSLRSRKPGPLTSPKVPSSWKTWAIPTMPGMGN
jgi:hypothetical protein